MKAEPSEKSLEEFARELEIKKVVRGEIKKVKEGLADALEWHKARTQRSFIDLETRLSILERRV
jgi:hypothetical protein